MRATSASHSRPPRTKYPCAARECEGKRYINQVFCFSCWRKLPQNMRDAIYAAYRRHRKERTPDARNEHVRVIYEAVKCLMEQEDAS